MSNAALLDQLMGKDRNLAASEKKTRKKIHWDDANICQSFICGFCPHDLFTNTKIDLGACPHEHSEEMKRQFEAESERTKARVMSRWIQRLKNLKAENDRKIARGHERLTAEVKEDTSSTEYVERQRKLTEINDNIETLLKEMETLGEEGKIEESQAINTLVEDLRKQKLVLESSASKEDKSLMNLGEKSKAMEVCEICAALLHKSDAESRKQAHLAGKLHLGYKTIRETVAEYDEREAAARTQSLLDEATGKSRDQERDKARRDRERDRERDRRDRDRDRSRRDRDRRDRDRGRRSRERDRGDRRSRSRSRDRGRDRNRV